MSSLGWIDFNSEDSAKVRTVLDLLSDTGVIDELGIGVIRDSFADRMFPGISTVQTRPKYFTLTAHLLKDYAENEVPKTRPRSLAKYLEEEEKWCRIEFVKAHGEGRQNLGIIGGTFGTDTNRDVVRKPSSIYWTGLRQYGFISPSNLSLVEFGRRLADGKHRLHALLKESGDGGGDDDDAMDHEHRIRIHAPERPEDYWETLTINLTKEEAEFLRFQIRANQPDSLLGQILMDTAIMDEILELSPSANFEDFAALPFVGSLKDESLRVTVRQARDFWRLLEGAHVRYNIQLQELLGTSEKLGGFVERWKNWRELLPQYLAEWDTGFMWSVVHERGSIPKPSTRQFVEEWIEECYAGAINESRCDALVKTQELRNKGKRARLRGTGAEGINSWIGLDGLNYRFSEVYQLVRDIRNAELGKGGVDA
ncbi:MAG: DUF6361 family protein [Verrucomicrobiales bacterium]|nr:DUF6361 family protein [Verrucomicrobiales bacterium]